MSNGHTPPPLNQIVDASVQSGTLELSPTQFGLGGGLDGWLLGYQDNRLPIAPWWCKQRDLDLRTYVKTSTILSSLAYNRVAQVQNLEWTIEAVDKRAEPLIEHYMGLFEDAQFGGGFREFLNNWVMDYHTQDNGAFVELIGEPHWEVQDFITDKFGNQFIAAPPLGNPAPGDPPHVRRAKAIGAIQGFSHLDSMTCWRTSNKEYPVIYRNPWKGYYVILHRSRVIPRAELSQPSELSRGIGFCAASRGFQAMESIQSMSDYVLEKVTGQSPEIGLVHNLPIAAIKSAVEDNALELDRKGLVRWKGVVYVQADIPPNGQPAGIELIGVKKIPDGFDREQEFTLNLYLLSLAWGSDLRDFGWSRSTATGTRADSESQDAKSSGKGREDAIATIEEFINKRILPNGLQFTFDRKDDLAAKRKAEIEKMRAEARSVRILSGELTPDEAREIAARDGDLPPEFMLTQTVVRGDDNPSDDSVSPVDATMPTPEQGEKSFNTYQRALLSLVNQYTKKLIDKRTFKTEMGTLISKQFLLGWQAGARELGVSWNTDESLNELGKLIAEEMQYIQQFADAVQNTTKAFTLKDIRRRVSIWANQFLRLKNRALMFLGGDKRLVWREGDTIQKCNSCKSLDGYVMTARQWYQRNIYPQDHQLECGGWECKCKLVPTDEPVTRAPFPIDIATLSGLEEVI